MEDLVHENTYGPIIKDLLEKNAVLSAEIANLSQCNKSGFSGTNLNRATGTRENRNRRQVPGTNFESGSTENRQFSRHGLSNSSFKSRDLCNKNQSPRNPPQDHSTPMIERASSDLSIFGYSNGDGAVNFWATESDPLTAYNLHYQSGQPFKPRQPQKPYPGRFQELAGVGETVDDYMARTIHPSNPSLFISPPMDFGANSETSMDRRISTTSSSFGGSFGISSPLTPKSETLTMGSTLPSDMSRQSSCLEGLGMMRLSSSVSEYSHAGFSPQSDKSINLSPTSNEEQSLWLVGTGGAGQMLPGLSSVSPEKIDSFETPDFTIEDMQRSQSNDSSSSSASTSSRSKQQLQRQIQNATARRIAPKQEDDLIMSRQDSISPINSICQHNVQDHAVTAIPKMTYQRPKHKRVYCDKCEEQSDGFRGEHELRRHQDRQHKLVVKKYICIEPLRHSRGDPEPITPLSKCKACCQQKKRYGAYYNAAAHLRRAHFRPKPKSRTKGSRIEDKSQKRGGKGGGDWPSMAQLKVWMQEVDELVPDNQMAAILECESVAEDAEVDIILATNKTGIRFSSTPDLNDVSTQSKPSFHQTGLDARYAQLNVQESDYVSAMQTKSAPTHMMQRTRPNMQQKEYSVRHLDSTVPYDPRMFVDISSFDVSFYNNFGDTLQDMEFDHLPNSFM